MSIRIGINGFGRIGKLVFRLAISDPDIEVAHVNDKMSVDLMVHLIKYDSIHGKFLADIRTEKNYIIINGNRILITHYPQPAMIPWQKNKAEIVVESSGQFKTRQKMREHLQEGVKKVILSCPSDDESIDRTVVMGVNHGELLPSDRIISNSSCTANCVAIVLKVLIEGFGVLRAFMNTIHPFTNNQNLQDGYHQDFRRARSAMSNIIPTTSTAINSIPLILPEMRGIFAGFATRVPVADCSFIELTAQLSKGVSVKEINDTFKMYAGNQLSNYLEYCADPIVSSDVTNNYHSAIFDSLSTRVLINDLIQLIAWYDNESGYSARMIELIKYIAQL
ncbi:MAG: type I glyceraldehyde-3-phosphate dehydrogenase [Candidatus Cloacimonetes bacterium]|nr:type I glyceraldehyde-3-phosphate dehydrogenase [Candidatus Cloacimonadota bacterium]